MKLLAVIHGDGSLKFRLKVRMIVEITIWSQNAKWVVLSF